MSWIVFSASLVRAQESDPAIDGYVPPPMFGPTPTPATTTNDPIAFPVETITKSNSLNPANDATTPEAVPEQNAEVVPAPVEVPRKSSRKVPPVPPQRPSTLTASQAYLDQQKVIQAEKEAAALAEKVQSQIDIAKDPNAPAPIAAPVIVPAPVSAEASPPPPAPSPAELKPVVAEEIKPDSVPTVSEEPPQEIVEEAPPPAPVPSPALNQKLMGQELANPSVQEILDSLEDKPIKPKKTPLPVGPKEPTERMIIVRSAPDSGPSIRIHAKRPPKKKETAHAFFIVFEPDNTEITDLGKTNFDKKIVPILNESPDLMLQIQAYAKADKGNEEAQRISLARANSIRTFFMEKNIAPERIQIHALGALSTIGTPDRVDIMLIRELSAKPVAKAPEKKEDPKLVDEEPAGPVKPSVDVVPGPEIPAVPPLPEKAAEPAKTP